MLEPNYNIEYRNDGSAIYHATADSFAGRPLREPLHAKMELGLDYAEILEELDAFNRIEHVLYKAMWQRIESSDLSIFADEA